jgi:long-chain fatty acid transport protein
VRTGRKYWKLKLALASVAGFAGALGMSPRAQASGYGLREGAPDWLGNAFAGAPAKAYDPGTVWSNPAGMALLDSDAFEGAVSYIGPSAQFTGAATDPLTGGHVSGVQGGNAVAAAASGATFGVWDLAPNWRAGFSVTAPFGERTSYPADWVGRYQSLTSSITDLNLGLALSYQVNGQLSIGGGPNFDYFDARLTQKINVPALSALTGQDPVADVHGNSLGVGYNIGVLYQFDADTRIGLDYHSRIRHDINGAQKVTVPAIYSLYSPAAVALLSAANSRATTTITLPDSLSAGIYHHISWYAGVGMNYQLLDAVMLQTGFGYDESPVTDANRTTRVPDADHYDLGFGVQYQINPNANLQFAYAHVFTPGGTINSTASTSALTPSGAILGSYADSDNSVTLGMVLKF